MCARRLLSFSFDPYFRTMLSVKSVGESRWKLRLIYDEKNLTHPIRCVPPASGAGRIDTPALLSFEYLGAPDSLDKLSHQLSAGTVVRHTRSDSTRHYKYLNRNSLSSFPCRIMSAAHTIIITGFKKARAAAFMHILPTTEVLQSQQAYRPPKFFGLSRRTDHRSSSVSAGVPTTEVLQSEHAYRPPKFFSLSRRTDHRGSSVSAGVTDL